MITVRPAETDADLEAWRAVRIAVHPDERTATVEEIRAGKTPEQLHLLAALDGDVIACGFASRSQDGERVFVAPRVRPDRRRRGAGRALLVELAAHARSLGAERVLAHVDGGDEGSIAFARRFAFEEVDRQVEQVRLLGDEPTAEFPAGVEVTTIAERPELLEQAYELAVQGYADMATHRPVTISLDEWLREEATHPAGSFVALAPRGGPPRVDRSLRTDAPAKPARPERGADTRRLDVEIVGYSGLVRDSDRPDRAEDGLTVVRRDWRGRGLATALKRAELAWAAAHGIREVYTWTQRGNDAMRAVNERLGYEYRHVELTMEAPLAAVLRAL